MHKGKQSSQRVTQIIGRTKANLCHISKYKWGLAVIRWRPSAWSSDSETTHFTNNHP